MENYFRELNSINCSDKTEKKNGLTYLSWAWAWGEIKKLHPDATYTIYEDANGLFYHTDGKTCWVKTGVTVNGIEHIEYLPVMDNRNRSIPASDVTSFDANKAIQRSLRVPVGNPRYRWQDLLLQQTLPVHGLQAVRFCAHQCKRLCDVQRQMDLHSDRCENCPLLLMGGYRLVEVDMEYGYDPEGIGQEAGYAKP